MGNGKKISLFPGKEEEEYHQKCQEIEERSRATSDLIECEFQTCQQ